MNLIAFMFPGQGSQFVGMGKDLAERFSVFRETLEMADDALGESLSRLCFDGPEEVLRLTANTQPAVLAVSIAIYRLLESRGVKPVMVAGHSLGEYSAHVAAGTLSFGDALRIVRRRGSYMQEAVPVGTGAMAAIIGLDSKLVEQACRESANGEIVSPANMNAPGQVVIAGDAAAVERAGQRVKALGARRVMPLPVSAPFHCELMRPAQVRLEPELRRIVVSDPSMPVIANCDALPKKTAAEAVEALVNQVSAPVLWEEVVREMCSSGIKTCVEVGPGKVLTGLIKKIDPEVTVWNVSDVSSFLKVEESFVSLSSEE
tara:strand:+ start:2111 stop:3061 length:951 start_codon:yes stop_codon:yes gene_type:complete